jgi:hypothetical protein
MAPQARSLGDEITVGVALRRLRLSFSAAQFVLMPYAAAGCVVRIALVRQDDRDVRRRGKPFHQVASVANPSVYRLLSLAALPLSRKGRCGGSGRWIPTRLRQRQKEG